MWEISRAAKSLVSTATVLFACSAVASADDDRIRQNSYLYGYTLPQIPVPYGSDQVRAADGTTCQSAVGGDGSFVDFGAIGTPPTSDVDESASVYARVVIPLGRKPKRIDCSQLYELEIARLRYELELARMGMNGLQAQPAPDGNANWADTGWTTGGVKKGKKEKAKKQ